MDKKRGKCVFNLCTCRCFQKKKYADICQDCKHGEIWHDFIFNQNQFKSNRSFARTAQYEYMYSQYYCDTVDNLPA